MADTVVGWEPDFGEPTPLPLDAVIERFRRWLYLPDVRPLVATCATIAANRRSGDPVWLILVAPPGKGKTEILNAATGLADVHPTATMTEAALLSGTPKREKAGDATGGLLRVIGEAGIILCKDFTSVLSMHREARAAMLSALREVYDGAWTRHLGIDGGRTLSWHGKVGLIAGVTPTIDRHHGVMAAMGERFVLLRMPPGDDDAQTFHALAHDGREAEMRAELTFAVESLFAGELTEPRERTGDETAWLIALSTFAARARSSIERDGYSREIELIPDPETPTRLAKMLARLLDGLDMIGYPRADALDLIEQAALDSIPATRLACLMLLDAAGEQVETAAVADTLGYPTSTARPTLEDLAAHGAVKRFGADTRSHSWAVTEWAATRLRSIREARP